MNKDKNELYESIRNDFYYIERVKDLYEVVRAFEKYVMGLAPSSDYTVVGLMNDVLVFIENFEKVYPLSNDMSTFLRRRVTRAACAAEIL